MLERKGYVYRFLDERNRVLYVGKTVQMERRMQQHFSSKSHLARNGKGDLYEKVYTIEYIKCKDEFTALQKELYYINLYKPPYNTASKIKQMLDFSDATDKWKVYRVVRQVSDKQQIENERINKLIPLVYVASFIAIIVSFLLR